MASAAKALRVSFVQCRGTPYEVGRAQADAFAPTRKGKAFRRKKIRRPPWFDMRAEHRAFKAYAPAFHNYGNGAQTLHTIIAEPAKLRLLIGGDAAALDEDMLDVDFKLWVAGEDLPTKQLKGQLGLGYQAPRRARAQGRRQQRS